MSLADGAPAYGGTPSDESVIRLIQDLKERGLEVVLYPFVMMDVPAGNALPDPYGGTGQPRLSLARAHHLRSRAGRGRLARRHRCRGDAGRTLVRRAAAGFNRMVLHYADLAEEAGGVDGLHPRQRARRPDARALGIGRLSGGRAAAGLGGGGARDPAARRRRSSMRPTGRNTARMFSTAAARCAFPLDPLFAARRHRCGRHRLLSADLRLARRPGPCRSGGGAQRLRRRLPARAARRRRGLRLVLCQRIRARAQTRTPITDGAYGKPWVFRPEGSRLLVVEPACGARGRRRDRRDRMAAAIEADLAHRDRHSRRRQGAERTERLSRSEIVGIRLSAVLPRRARRSRAGARRWRRSCRASIRRSAASRPSTIPVSTVLWRAHGRPGQRLRLGLGCAALSRPFPISTSCGRTAPTGRPATGSPGRIEGATLDRLIAAHPARFRLRRSRPAFPSTVSSTAM